MNYLLNINLLKLKGAFVANLNGTNERKTCLCIPISESDMAAGEKGVYLDLNAYEVSENQFGQSHLLKQRLAKAKYESLSPAERDKLPIIGNMKKISFDVAYTAPDINITETDKKF